MDVIFWCSVRVLIDVQFCNGQFVLIFVSDFIQNWGDYFVWIVLFCLEIDEDCFVCFEYICVKIVVSQVNNFIVYI